MNIRVPDNLAEFILTIGFYAALQAQDAVQKNNDAVRVKAAAAPTNVFKLREVKRCNT